MRKDDRFGAKARRSGQWVHDREVAAYVAQHPDRLVGFMCLDPTQPGWREEMEEGHVDLKLKGIKLLPMYAGFSPTDRELDDMWTYASKHGLPVLLHTGTTFVANAPLACTLPRLIDEVALRFPDVKIVMAHLGHPWEGECIATIRKHDNVYADCSPLHYRPFQLYHSLMLLQEYGVWRKLLFGSDYPFTTVDASLAGMRKLNDMLAGTALSRLNMDEMEKTAYQIARPYLASILFASIALLITLQFTHPDCIRQLVRRDRIPSRRSLQPGQPVHVSHWKPIAGKCSQPASAASPKTK